MTEAVRSDMSGEDYLRFVNHYFSAAFRGSVGSLAEFFDLLARSSRERLGATLVTVWNNNVHGRYLVLVGSSPARNPAHGSYTISRQTSLTGLAIERCDIVWHTDLGASAGERQFENPAIAKALGLRRMLSIPIFDPFNLQFVTCVLDLLFDEDFPAVTLQRGLLHWLATATALALDHLFLRIDDDIRRSLGALTARATGMAQLFEGIAPVIVQLTGCSVTALFRRDDGNRLALLAASDAGPTATKYAKVIDQGDSELSQPDRQMYETCVLRMEPFMSCGTAEWHSYSRMATPVLSERRDVLGVLQCNLTEAAAQTRSFSSLDLEILVSFASSLAPLMERFNRLREGSTLVISLLDKVTAAAVNTARLEDVLRKTIETLATSLDAGSGSIYLLDESTGAPKLVMRAAYGVDRPLVGRAEYAIGEGITGQIARGNIINQKSWEEREAYPGHLGKYNTLMDGREQARGSRSPAFLGVPIQHRNKLLGVWKLEYLLPSHFHPEDYFTDEDEQIGRIISSFLAYVIEHERHREIMAREFSLLAQSSIEIERARTEEDAILAVMAALESSGWRNALLSLYYSETREIRGYLASKRMEPEAIDLTRADIAGQDLLAVVLRSNQAEFVPDSTADSRCNSAVMRASGMVSQYVLPLRLDDEIIGTLQVDMGRRSAVTEDEALVLKAFAGHLALAISRIRGIEKMLELTNQVMSSSRFIVAEALSGVVVHSLGHKLDIIVKQLGADLERKEIREREALLIPLKQWYASLAEGKKDLDQALQLVKGGAAAAERPPTHLQPLIQECISMWFTLLKTNKCKVDTTLEADESSCAISPHVFREIMSVLIVNAVQAYAKRIEIKTFNEERVHIGANFIRGTAFCLEFSDDGVGLVTDTAEEIFAATYTTKPEKFGTGLGLFIARRLARDAGGELVVLAGRAKGVAFRLGLPVIGRARA